MRISDWSSDVCSSDLLAARASEHLARGVLAAEADAMSNQARDYGTWTEAVVRLLTEFDAAWADENIGTWGYAGLGMSATLVIASNDEVISGMAAGEFIGHTIVTRFGKGLQDRKSGVTGKSVSVR